MKQVDELRLILPINEIKIPKSTRKVFIDLIAEYDMSSFHELDELELHENEQDNDPVEVILPTKVNKLKLKGPLIVENSEDVTVKTVVVERNSDFESLEWANDPVIEYF